MYVKQKHVPLAEHIVRSISYRQIYRIGEADISCAVRGLRQITISYRRISSVFAGDCDLCGGRMIYSLREYDISFGYDIPSV